MQNHLLSFQTDQQIHPVLASYYRLRKDVFIDQLGWNIEENNGFEMDQYDRLGTHYALITQGAEVVAGVRIMRTTAVDDKWSYMIRDARLGLLDGMPNELIDDAPQAEDCFELSRIIMKPDLKAADRQEAMARMLETANEFIALSGGNYILAISHPALKRVFARLGYFGEQLGPVMSEGKSRWCVMGGPIAPLSLSVHAA